MIFYFFFYRVLITFRSSNIFNKITNNDKLKIDATELKEQGKNIRQQLEKIMQSVAEQKQQASAEDKLMYG